MDSLKLKASGTDDAANDDDQDLDDVVESENNEDEGLGDEVEERIHRHYNEKRQLLRSTYQLIFPFKSTTGDIVSQVTVKRPRAGQMENMSANPKIKDLLDIAGKCSGLMPKDVKKIDGADALILTELVADFLDPGQSIGKST